MDLHLRVVTLANGLRIGGFNGSWKYKPRGHFLYDQDEAAVLLQQLPAVDILVTHNSPADVHERDADVHQGFLDGLLVLLVTRTLFTWLHLLTRQQAPFIAFRCFFA